MIFSFWTISRMILVRFTSRLEDDLENSSVFSSGITLFGGLPRGGGGSSTVRAHTHRWHTGVIQSEHTQAAYGQGTYRWNTVRAHTHRWHTGVIRSGHIHTGGIQM